MDLGTLIGSKTLTSIRVNGLLVPANSIADHLQRYTDPALFHTEGQGQFHLSKSGSLVRIRLGDRFFAVTSVHQLDLHEYKYDQLCLLRPDRERLVTLHRVVFPENISDQRDIFDCLIFDSTEVVKEGALRASDFHDYLSKLA